MFAGQPAAGQPYTAPAQPQTSKTRLNEKYNFEKQKTLYRCIQIDQWDDSKKSFVVRAPFQSTCYTTPYLPYPAPA